MTYRRWTAQITSFFLVLAAAAVFHGCVTNVHDGTDTSGQRDAGFDGIALDSAQDLTGKVDSSTDARNADLTDLAGHDDSAAADGNDGGSRDTSDTLDLIADQLIGDGGSAPETTDAQFADTESDTLGEEAPFTAGETKELTGATAGDQGATLTAPPGSPIEGVEVSFPKDAVPAGTELSLGYNSGQVNWKSGTQQTPVIELTSSFKGVFGAPVSITIPCLACKTGGRGTPFYIDDSGHLHAAGMVAIDKANGRVTFHTMHASKFTLNTTDEGVLPDDFTMDSGFRLALHGFSIANFETQFSSSGQCEGMVFFSAWYFGRNGLLFDNFRDSVEDYDSGVSYSVQQLIASRAHLSMSYTNEQCIYQLQMQSELEDSDILGMIIDTMENTGSPVPLIMFNPDTLASHEVIAIGVDKLGNSILIELYDPNFPNQAMGLRFDADTGLFDSYSNYTVVYFDGFGSYIPRESMDTILRDANESFHGTPNATIAVISHKNGDLVPARDVTIVGTIESGIISASKVIATVSCKDGCSGGEYSVVAGAEDFVVTVRLGNGVNLISFEAEGAGYHGTSEPITVSSSPLKLIYSTFETSWSTVPAGLFTMGCVGGDKDCQADEKPSHQVFISEFKIMQTEVTEAQFQEVMGFNPSAQKYVWPYAGGPECPVDSAESWAKAFCEAIGARLPTEAEWEKAARAGTNQLYVCGNDIECFEGINSGEGYLSLPKKPVKTYPPNGYGIFDMGGNLGEYVLDEYDAAYYATSPDKDPCNVGEMNNVRGYMSGMVALSSRISNRVGPNETPDERYVSFRCAK